MLYCTPAEMRIEDEESIMSSDDIAREVITLDETWHKVVTLVCKEEYIPTLRVRRFIYLMRDVTGQIENLLDADPFTDDILLDINVLVESFEVFDHFMQRYVDLPKEDLPLYQTLKDDIEDSLLRLLYIGEEAAIEDGVMIVFCIPIP